MPTGRDPGAWDGAARCARRFVVLLAVLAVAGGGCTRRAPAPRLESSDFLGSVRGFHPDPRRPGSLVYRRPRTDLAAYDRLLVDPVVIRAAPASAAALTAADREHLARYFRRALERSVGDAYPLVTASAPRVLHLRAALTGLVPTTREQMEVQARLADPTDPVAAAVRRNLGRVQIEAELLDPLSGERLFASIDGAPTDRRLSLPSPKALTRWGHVERTIDAWARRLRERLDAWRGG